MFALQAPRAAAAAPRTEAAEPAPAVSTAEALSRLGAGEEDGYLLAGGPLWFKKEAFTAPEFDPDEYVRDLRRYVRRAAAARTASNALFAASRADGLPRARCRWRRCARSWTRTWRR